MHILCGRTEDEWTILLCTVYVACIRQLRDRKSGPVVGKIKTILYQGLHFIIWAVRCSFLCQSRMCVEIRTGKARSSLIRFSFLNAKYYEICDIVICVFRGQSCSLETESISCHLPKPSLQWEVDVFILEINLAFSLNLDILASTFVFAVHLCLCDAEAAQWGV